MKKLTAALIVLALLSAGCGSAAPVPTESTAAPTEQTIPATTEALGEPEIMQEDMSAVAVPATIELLINSEGNGLFSYTGQSMSLVVPDPDVADKIIIDFLTRQDSFRSAAQSIASSCVTESAFYNALYAPTRIDQNVMSLAGSIVSWSGGSHPTYNCISANYDMVTGDVLTLGSILTHEDQADALCDLVIEAISPVQQEHSIWDDYAKTIQARFDGNISYDQAWFFDTQGLCFSFPPYEIAPYHSGIVTVTVPYEKLVGIIEDAFFPVERISATGEVTAQLLEEADTEAFTQIAELVLDEEGQMVLLYTDKAVHDVSLLVDGEYTAFAASSLTPGDAIMVQADWDAHTVAIQYHSNGQKYSRYIQISQNSVELTEE